MDPRFRILPRPKGFSSSISLLIRAEKTPDTCQNIQPGVEPINIFQFVKFKEVKFKLH